MRISPSENAGYNLYFGEHVHWFLHEAQAIAMARDLCPDCLLTVYRADGTVRAVYEPLVGRAEMAAESRRNPEKRPPST